MRHKKRRRNDAANKDATRASVAREMAAPRMARSARIAERNLDPNRIPDQPSTTLTGTVKKIIPSQRRSQPEEAQIAIKEADRRRHQDLRIENTLIDEDGAEVKLKKGARVAVTVAGGGETKNAATRKEG